MHRAPAVTVELPDDPAWRGIESLCRGLAATALGWGVFGHLVGPWAALAGIAGLATLAAGSRWRRSATSCRLQWDGACWRLDSRPGQARIAADLGGWLLVHFDAAVGPSSWHGVRLARLGAVGPTLRRALVTHDDQSARDDPVAV